MPPDQLVEAIRAVARGDAVLAPAATRRLLEAFGSQLTAAVQGTRRVAVLEALTTREVEVFHQLATGASNQEIATALVLSEHTVKIHVSRVLAKLGLRDRIQAVILAYETGLITPSG